MRTKKMRTIKFLNDNVRLNVSGLGYVDKDNITPDLYDRLIELSPAHEAFFLVSNNEPEQEVKPKNKPKQKSDDTDLHTT
jgi:hypothetical protein